MKKLVLALTALAALSGSALAADLPTKAPMYQPPAPVYNWTGCYIGGGAGYGWYTAESREVDRITGAVLNREGDTGGKGWLGQVGAGCDYQFTGPLGNWVVGAFGDYIFSNVHGDHIGAPATLSVGSLKEDNSWAVGGRIGYLVNPAFLTYVNAGWTETHFANTTYFNSLGTTVLANGTFLPGATYQGWFIGSGFEYNFDLFGFRLPGLFLKSEYRYSEFDRKQLNVLSTTTGLPTGAAETIKPFTQSVITSLVYRFNWTGAPVAAKY
jgi:outer membrane immunogenic protein